MTSIDAVSVNTVHYCKGIYREGGKGGRRGGGCCAKQFAATVDTESSKHPDGDDAVLRCKITRKGPTGNIEYAK